METWVILLIIFLSVLLLAALIYIALLVWMLDDLGISVAAVIKGFQDGKVGR